MNTNFSTDTKIFLLISFFGFLLSLFFINLFYLLSSNEKISSIFTVILIFFYNFYFIKKKFQIKKIQKLFYFLISLSFLFRVFELLIFNYLLEFITSINLSWIVVIGLSFSLKIYFYPILLRKI